MVNLTSKNVFNKCENFMERRFLFPAIDLSNVLKNACGFSGGLHSPAEEIYRIMLTSLYQS